MPEGAAVRVKICGVTNAADAELAVQLGAWAVGMVFYDGSPRRCSRDAAREIAAAVRRKVMLCGVYVNETLEQIEHDCDELGLDAVQLHGDEGPAFCAEVARRAGVRIIKAVQVAGPGDVRDIARFHVDYHLLDGGAAAANPAGPRDRRGPRGGTGETFDWSLIAARDRAMRVPLILSGGLNAGNVGEAIAATDPYAVDSASGTESAPGHKDPARMRDLFDAVAQAASAQAPSGHADAAPSGHADAAPSGHADAAPSGHADAAPAGQAAAAPSGS